MSCWRIRAGALLWKQIYYLLEKIVDMKIWSKKKMKQSEGTRRPLN